MNASVASAESAIANPLLEESPYPFQLPAFDRIQPGHFKPAFEQGMAEQLAEIAAIAQSHDSPTFENTIVAMERSGHLLERVHRVFNGLNSAHTNDSLQEVEAEIEP